MLVSSLIRTTTFCHGLERLHTEVFLGLHSLPQKQKLHTGTRLGINPTGWGCQEPKRIKSIVCYVHAQAFLVTFHNTIWMLCLWGTLISLSWNFKNALVRVCLGQFSKCSTHLGKVVRFPIGNVPWLGKNLTFTTNQVSALVEVFGIGSDILKACVLHNLVLFVVVGKKKRMAEGGGGSPATVITNKKHLSHLCNLFSFNMRSMLVEICEFWDNPWRRDQSTLSLFMLFSFVIQAMFWSGCYP